MAVLQGASLGAAGPSPRWRDALRKLARHRSAMVGLVITAIIAALALLAPLIAPHDPLHQNLRQALAPPSATHWMGTDEFGRDIFSRILFGAGISLQVGLLVVFVSGVSGVILGLLAGFYGGWVDMVISRAIEILLAFPGLLLAIAIVTILGPS